MIEKSAFLSGFHKGFSAPFSLFAQKEEKEPLELKQIKTNIGGWESDWAKLGGDMQRAMGYVTTSSR